MLAAGPYRWGFFIFVVENPDVEYLNIVETLSLPIVSPQTSLVPIVWNVGKVWKVKIHLRISIFRILIENMQNTIYQGNVLWYEIASKILT